MDFYLFQICEKTTVLYSEGERIDPKTRQEMNPDYANPVNRLLDKLNQRKGRFSRLARNLIIVVRDAYYKIEEKIDPMERVFKRMRHAKNLNLYYSREIIERVATGRFTSLLVRHRRKHGFWMAVDLVITLVMIALSPILVPIPGPNVLFYYPAARLISHYLARRGTLHGLNLTMRTYSPLPEIYEIETLLARRSTQSLFEQVRPVAQRLHLEHLPHFLKRYV